MRCSKAQHLLELKLDHELSQSHTPALELHLSQCPKCREYQAQAIQLKQMLKARPIQEFPNWLHHQIMDKAAQHDARRMNYNLRWKLQSVPALLAIILSLSIGGLVGKAAFVSLTPFPDVADSVSVAQDEAPDQDSFGEVYLIDDFAIGAYNE